MKLLYCCAAAAQFAMMVLALTRPDLVRRLVVADIAPVTYAHSQQPQIDAMRRVNLVIAPAKVNAVLIEEMLIN